MKTKKITAATVKSFIRKNENHSWPIFINTKSSFDGMTDCCESQHDGFVPAKKTTDNIRNTWGIFGAWFVNNSRDYFTTYKKNGMIGYEISNACGHFVLAIQNQDFTNN